MPVVVLPNVRLRYPHLWKAQPPHRTAPPGALGSFGTNGIFAKDSEAFTIAQQAFVAAATEKWGDNAMGMIQSIPSDKKCIRSGDTKRNSKDGSQIAGYAGMFYIAANRGAKEGAPLVVSNLDYQGKAIQIGEDGSTWVDGVKVALPFQVKQPYQGCYCNLKVDIYAMQRPGEGAQINAKLIAVQWHADGEAFGGSGPATAEGFGFVAPPVAAAAFAAPAQPAATTPPWQTAGGTIAPNSAGVASTLAAGAGLGASLF